MMVSSDFSGRSRSNQEVMMVVIMVRVRVIGRLHDMVLHLFNPLLIQMMVVHGVRVVMVTTHNHVER